MSGSEECVSSYQLGRLEFHLPSAETKAGQTMVRVEDFIFGYGSGESALIKNLSFVLRGRDKIAITGVNGSGKTTLLKLVGGQDTAKGMSKGKGCSWYAGSHV